MTFDMPVPPLSRMIAGLCDGTNDLTAIHAAVREKRSEMDYDAFRKQFDAFYRVMNAINKLVLRLPPSA